MPRVFPVRAALVGLAAIPIALAAGREPLPRLGATPGTVDVTVREGTSMAIALSPDRRQIAIDLQGGLWVVPIGGGEARRVTDEWGDSRQPDWAPDGSRIAFQSYRDGTWRIWTIRPDGTDLRALTSGPFDDREPHWSPDGRAIAFSSDRSGHYDIWTLEVATGALHRITTDPGNDFFPAWSRDGRAIAFVSTRPSAPGVYTIALGGPERLAARAWGSIGAPSWSPDGRILVSVVPSPVGLAAPAAPPGTAAEPVRLVLGDRILATGEDYHPFRAQWLSGDEFLYPADGVIKRRTTAGEPRPAIAFTATLAVRPASYTKKARDLDSTAPRPVLGLLRPTLSPDGTRLAFGALGDLWLQPLDGRPGRLTNDAHVDTDPAWSPDGRRLAFSSDRGGSLDVWVRDLTTGVDHRLTSSTDAEMAPAWSPDGSTIAYVANQAYEQGELWVVPSHGGGTPRRLLSRRFGVGQPSWTADGRTLVASAIQPYSSRFREAMNYYWTVPVEGGEPEVVVPAAHVPIGRRAGDGPVVAPDGRHLAYASSGLLHVQPVDARARPAGPPRPLGGDLADLVSWAGPDRLLVMATDRLVLVDIATGARREVPVPLTWQPQRPAGRLVVHAGRLIDGVSPEARTDVDLVIEGHRIAAVVPHADAQHTGRVVDASAQTVFPGLIEGHGHTLIEHGTQLGRVHLAYGITGFRDVGGQPYDILESREAIESGRRAGPRIFTTGYLHDGARPYYPMASTVPTADALDRELSRAQRLGYDTFKTYVRLSDLLQQRAIAGAHALGIPVSSHEIYPAALAGADSVEHTGATSRRGYSTKQSLTGRAYEDVIRIVATSRMTLTPTLGLGGFQSAVATDPALLADERWRRLQPAWTEAAVRARAATARARGGLTPAQDTVRALHRAGATLIAGVDSPLTPYGIALHVELEDYVAAGLSPLEAIRTASRNPAELLGLGRDLGTLEPGKLADLVIVDGNPLADIRDTRRVRLVIRNGEVHTIEALLSGQP